MKRKTEMRNHMMTATAIAFGVLAIGSVLSGCSLSAPDRRVVRIELPRDFAARSEASLAARLFQNADYTSTGSEDDFIPRSFDEFRCFGINVTGPGIGPDLRMPCKDPGEMIGLVGGLVSVSGGVLEVVVPSGPARRIQLFGTAGPAGCLSLNEAFNHPDDMKLGDPFALGEVTVDVFQDATVTIEAAYDPLAPKKLFESCGDGGGSDGSYGPGTPSNALRPSLARAVKGTIVQAGMSTPTRSVFDDTSLLAASGASELGDEELLLREFEFGTAAEMPEFSSSNSAIMAVGGISTGGAANTGFRPYFQFRWDVTDIDLTRYGILDLQLQIAGSKNCPISTPPLRVASGLLRTDATWEWRDLEAWDNKVRWNPTYASVASYVFPLDGRKYIVLAVTSDLFVQGGGCSSSLAVSGLGLTLHDLTSPPEIRLHGLDLSHQFTPGHKTSLGAYGGEPPYTFKASSGSISSGHEYIVPAGVHADIITVIDAAGREKPFTVQILPGNYWVGQGSLTVSRQKAQAVRLGDGRILVYGGLTDAANQSELYDPYTGASAAIAAEVRSAHTAVALLDGSAFVCGGYAGVFPVSSCQRYMPGFGFQAAPALTIAKAEHTATLLQSGRVLLAGGKASSFPTAVTDIYDPWNEVIQGGPSMNVARYGHTATLLNDGKVLIVGGYGVSSPLATAELFDPNYTNIAEGFSVLTSAPQPRALHTATKLPNGLVLIVGGVNSSNIATSEVELYDPGTQVFSLIGSLSVPRRGHIAQLVGGKVIVAGGQDDQGNLLSSVEVFDPLSKTFSLRASLMTPRKDFTSAVLLDGSLVIFGGFGFVSGTASVLNSVERYYP